jgi:glycosyltransferase involved in cell wall biosynthesis
VRRDIPQLMNAADAYAMSSAWEGLPMVLLEAAAVGCPIVATAVGGNHEAVCDHISGFLVPPRKPEAFAEAMRRMMELRDDERSYMGMTGRYHVQANYSLERVVDNWEELYHACLNH